MLVDIDLLPKRQARNLTTPIIIGICIMLMLLVIIALTMVNSFVQKDISQAEMEYSMAQALREAKEVAVRSPEQSTSAQKLEATVQWVESYPVEMVPILDHLVGLLPERGLIQNFSYTETSSISLSVQFDSSREVAYYLNHLNTSPLIEEVTLSSISTSSVAEEEDLDVLPRYIGQFTITLNNNYVEEEGDE